MIHKRALSVGLRLRVRRFIVAFSRFAFGRACEMHKSCSTFNRVGNSPFLIQILYRPVQLEERCSFRGAMLFSLKGSLKSIPVFIG